MLKRAARFLRVVEAGGKFDALDQLGDMPAENEKIYAYEILGEVGYCHINRSGGRGGSYPIANYKIVNPQPEDKEMRTTEAWRKWTLKKKDEK